ncbi:MAG: bifunctional DNA-formamidopyrimidine glycosylase/DNA-(apurinic or apyrimidinic site) lyase [bacterium]|nr:bifunctional DNA-formamidopyrimidine glycosylase/DNA-(apurinic or apyrimidinic site) lyase [bacterium]
MPELPEVETIRRGLQPVLSAGTVTEVEVRHPRMLRRQPVASDFADRMEGSTIGKLGRIGKFLLIEVGDQGNTWVLHMGMSGRMEIAGHGTPEPVHTRVVIRTEAGQEVRMVDTRTFGFVAVYTPEELASSTIARLGPDAWTELPASGSADKMAGRRVAIKSLLLDQRFLAGLGNIYADEVLFGAGVQGTRPAGSLTTPEIQAIFNTIPKVLAEGLRHGGTSLDDLAYLLPDGRAGQHLDYLSVYGREGKPCRRCGSGIVREKINGRSSYSCVTCQT